MWQRSPGQVPAAGGSREQRPALARGVYGRGTASEPCLEFREAPQATREGRSHGGVAGSFLQRGEGEARLGQRRPAPYPVGAEGLPEVPIGRCVPVGAARLGAHVAQLPNEAPQGTDRRAQTRHLLDLPPLRPSLCALSQWGAAASPISQWEAAIWRRLLPN